MFTSGTEVFKAQKTAPQWNKEERLKSPRKAVEDPYNRGGKFSKNAETPKGAPNPLRTIRELREPGNSR